MHTNVTYNTMYTLCFHSQLDLSKNYGMLITTVSIHLYIMYSVIFRPLVEPVHLGVRAGAPAHLDRSRRGARISTGLDARLVSVCFLIVDCFFPRGKPNRDTRESDDDRKIQNQSFAPANRGPKGQLQHTTKRYPAPHLRDKLRTWGPDTTPELEKSPAVNDGSHRAITTPKNIDPGTNSRTN